MYRWLNREPGTPGKFVYGLFAGVLIAATSLLVAYPPMDLTYSDAIHDFLIDPFFQAVWRSVLFFLLMEAGLLRGLKYDRWSFQLGVMLTIIFTIWGLVGSRVTLFYILLIFVQNLAFTLTFLKCGGVEGRYLKAFLAGFLAYASAMVLYFCSGFIVY